MTLNEKVKNYLLKVYFVASGVEIYISYYYPPVADRNKARATYYNFNLVKIYAGIFFTLCVVIYMMSGIFSKNKQKPKNKGIMKLAPSPNPQSEGKKFTLLGLAFAVIIPIVFFVPDISYLFTAPGLAFSARAVILNIRVKDKIYIALSVIGLIISISGLIVRLNS